MAEQNITFCEQTKRSLAATYPKKECCRRALATGIYLTSRSFAQNGAITEPQWLCTLLSHIKRSTDFETVGALFTAEKPLSELCVCEGCLPSFLKGAFLCCATVTDPARSYHLEFSVCFPQVSEVLFEALEQLEFSPKRNVRRNRQLSLYLKDGERIADFFACIGAQKEAFSMMNTKIERDFRNSANRLTNCDTANIDKMIQAAQAQIEAITLLERHDLLRHLPKTVQESARLRLQNPDLPLQELARLHQSPVSKSGLNHRLQKLLKMAEQLDNTHTKEDSQ